MLAALAKADKLARAEEDKEDANRQSRESVTLDEPVVPERGGGEGGMSINDAIDIHNDAEFTA